jgi:hypothetical protein
VPKRSNEFQHLVTLIERLLADSDARVTESKELTDNIIGKPREVDIVIERNDGVRNIVIGVECSGDSTSRPATVEWVERMWGKHSSLPTDKLVLVSQSGFTTSAKKKAEWWNITVLSLKQAQDYDWETIVTKIGEVEIKNFLLPYVSGIKIIFGGDPNEKLDVNDLDLPKSTLYDPDGNAIGPLDLANRWLADPAVIRKLEEVAFTDTGTVIDFERELRRGCYLIDGKGVSRPVLALQVEARCRKEVSKIPLVKGSYGKAQIAHGAGTSFGRPTQVVFVQKQDEEPRVAISIKRSMQKGSPT